ncbi:helix-turn-helix domain-containing protein [Crossiella cryophila]|uniref:Transcriptional regulator with XRE-family HTH domain n=1 Tax=Crossiella cryophila TaxID=43355 RepID=A0A7W7CI22_9PSEU|nr:helix-turn-helix transcriptional regulator [Crossiella cryophila]MBB4681642.1 transcriptional regulator with XRE-family HTH domain [Crossiella cryophila]
MSSAERVSTERELAATFGERLRALRMSRGLTQRDLAGEGLSSSYLSRLESGQRTPTPKVVEQLAARLGVSAESFAGLGNGSRVSGGAFLAGAARVMDHLLAGRVVEALEVLDALRVDVREPQARWLCEYVAASCESRLGRTQDVWQRLAALEPMYRGLPTAARALSSTLQTVTARELGRNRDAMDLGQRAVAEADSLIAGDDFPIDQATLLRVKARTTLAAVYGVSHRAADAVEVAEQAVHLTAAFTDGSQPGDKRLADELHVISHWMHAVALARAGDLTESAKFFESALQPDAESIGAELWCRVRVGYVGIFLEYDLVADRAESLLDQVTDTRRNGGGQLDAQVLILRAELALRSNDLQAALDSAQTALDSGVVGTTDRIRTLMTVVKVSTDLGLEERRLSALDELLAHLDTADPEEVRPALLKEVAALSVRTLRNHHGRS